LKLNPCAVDVVEYNGLKDPQSKELNKLIHIFQMIESWYHGAFFK